MTGIPDVALVTGASRGLGAVIAQRLAARPAMKAQHRGRVIQIGSDIFDRGLPGMSAYIAGLVSFLGIRGRRLRHPTHGGNPRSAAQSARLDHDGRIHPPR